MTSESRYGSQDLWLHKSFYNEFVGRLVSQSKPEVSFRRQVDLWWYALCVGVTEQTRTPLPDHNSLVKCNNAGILESDPWRITHLELLTLSEEGQTAATNAAVVVRIANEYALTGCRKLTDGLRVVVEDQLHLINSIDSFIVDQ